MGMLRAPRRMTMAVDTVMANQLPHTTARAPRSERRRTAGGAGSASSGGWIVTGRAASRTAIYLALAVGGLAGDVAFLRRGTTVRDCSIRQFSITAWPVS